MLYCAALLGVSSLSSANNLRDRATPFLIAPMIEAIDLCKEALEAGIEGSGDALAYCHKNGFYNTRRLNDVLDKFEPKGAKGKVIVGYTYGVSLMGLYIKEQHTGQWKINQASIDRIIEQIIRMDRPVVLYLMSDHFDSASGLALELIKDDINLMAFKGGDTSLGGYFETSIAPFTLSSDDTIPINKYRFEAIREIVKKLLLMPAMHFKKIRAVTLNGETHHLFKDLIEGPAFNKDYLITDYSEQSVLGFREWLKNKFIKVSDFNNVVGHKYASFKDVIPPEIDINVDLGAQPYQHIDRYSNGFLPINGWVWDKNSIIKEMLVVLDGSIIGSIERNFSRLDVYQAVEEIETQNAGFRYHLNFSHLSSGQHEIKVVVKDKHGRYFSLGSKIITVNKGAGETIPTTGKVTYPLLCDAEKSNQCCIDIKPIETSHLTFGYWIDSFKYKETSYTYNKLSSLWLEYRRDQVSSFMTTIADVAIDSGLPRALVFSHQILTDANSDWDYNVLAAGEGVKGEHNYNIGINLYGGSQNTKAFKNLVTHRTKKIGIPEYNPQQHKNKKMIDQGLFDLYDMDVDFITPYFVSLLPDSMRGETDHNKFLIQNNNKEYGSNLFFQSIVEFSKN
jgi:hypothetical protein